MGLATAGAGAAACDKVASPLGSDAYPGTVAEPYATVEKLANSLHAGPDRLPARRRLPGRREGRQGRRAGRADHDHQLPRRARHRGGPLPRGRRPRTTSSSRASTSTGATATTCRARRSTATTSRSATTTSPTTTRRSASSSAATSYGRARGTVIERNRIHNCGQLPPTNHHHGIYVEASDGARITDNWIYDNADRGVQLFPDAQGTYIARNVIDGNGQGDHLLARVREQRRREQRDLQPGAALQHRGLGADRRRQRRAPQLRVEPSPPGQRAASSRASSVATVDNKVIDPGYMNRGDKDFRLRAGQPLPELRHDLQPAAKKRDEAQAQRGRAAARATPRPCGPAAACACGRRWSPRARAHRLQAGGR